MPGAGFQSQANAAVEQEGDWSEDSDDEEKPGAAVVTVDSSSDAAEAAGASDKADAAQTEPAEDQAETAAGGVAGDAAESEAAAEAKAAEAEAKAAEAKAQRESEMAAATAAAATAAAEAEAAGEAALRDYCKQRVLPEAADDSDDQLMHTLSLLKRIHSSYYDGEGAGAGAGAGVGAAAGAGAGAGAKAATALSGNVATLRAQQMAAVLDGCYLCFSGVFPTGDTNVHQSAVCQQVCGANATFRILNSLLLVPPAGSPRRHVHAHHQGGHAPGGDVRRQSEGATA